MKGKRNKNVKKKSRIEEKKIKTNKNNENKRKGNINQ